MRSPTIYSHISHHISSRNQVAQVNVFASNPRPVINSVLEGSLISLLLFHFYLSDVFNVVRCGVSFLFVDGSKMVHTFQSKVTDYTVAIITQDIIVLNTWASRWTKKFSAKKSCFML